MKKTLFVALIGLLLVATLPQVAACGGFFCTTIPIDQNAERIIFTVNDDGTITAVVGINYVGAAEDFSWVVPVPSPPELDVTDTEILDILENATNVRITPPNNPCRDLYQYGGRGGGGGGGFLETGNIGPFDFAIIGSEDPTELIQWLRDNGYVITEDMEPIVAEYVEEGMFFLALRLSQDAEVGDIRPIVMTYEAEKPTIPIRLTAVAAVDDMPVLTWIFADTQYVPENFAHPAPAFENFSAPHNVLNLGKDWTLPFGGFSSGSAEYLRERDRIQAEFDGLAFITEYAQPSDSQLMTDTLSQHPFLQELGEEFAYVTRLRAQMSPHQMTLDPSFIPAPEAPDFDNNVVLSDYVDPIAYYGCTSRNAVPEDNLPEGRTVLPALQAEVAHPDDWVMSEITYSGADVIVFSSDVVTTEALNAFFAGRLVPPMMILAEARAVTFPNNATTLLLQTLGLDDTLILPTAQDRPAVDYRTTPYGLEGEESDTIFVAVLANDWLQNGELYGAMLDYAVSFQHYQLPDMRHTLFLTNSFPQFSGDTIATQVPYPDGWIEATQPNGDIVIKPMDADEPVVRLIPMSRFDEDGVLEDDSALAVAQLVALDAYMDTYDFSDTVDRDSLLPELTLFEPTIGYEFDDGERRGLARYTYNYIIEASAPTGDFEQYQDVLQKITNGTTVRWEQFFGASQG